ncbi:Uncharacterized protein YpuA, DUF1002 family [Alteribacillus persepolensis]|uniref:Uncharacterized protein YpuA, DUF1002 family n=1 Tax=Alteribacillus persepolensis TaxID=568899 RepID=A0A1G8CVU5_9BACI|nr:DUF1002 domain-containing protein [Alteribacillus persepolensis]SDH49080.1 Uncharacterized protein YpuA, DUF1002 family [Alteribacillus persepolensis]
MIQNKFIAALLLAFIITVLPQAAMADTSSGDVTVTLGEDLTEAQKNNVLEEMNAGDSAEIITVTNEEEHNYLGEYMSASDIGERAISSSKITAGQEGDGIHVETNNITKITEAIYANTLITAGVGDAEVYITAPFDVSGTAALTGIIKAYEIQNDIDIPEEQKKVANEEMVKTSELGERIGMEEAAELMTRVKEEISETSVESEEDLRELVQRIANEMGIELTEEELNGIVSLFDRMKDLNINWDQVQNQITQIRDNLDEFLNREDTQSFIDSFLDFLNSLIEAVKGWFGEETESA